MIESVKTIADHAYLRFAPLVIILLMKKQYLQEENETHATVLP